MEDSVKESRGQPENGALKQTIQGQRKKNIQRIMLIKKLLAIRV